MSGDPQAPAAPSPHDVVEVTDVRSGHRVTAAVEEAQGATWLLSFDLAASVPEEASVHWDDGDVGWQANARLEDIEDTRARFRIASVKEWEPAPVRSSLRTPVDNSPMLVSVIESSSLPAGQRVHAVCLDISNSGCRLSWPAREPHVGDRLDVSWQTSSWHEAETDWIKGRVARVTRLPFGARHVGIQFDLTDPSTAAHVRRLSRLHSQAHRQRTRTRRA